MNNKQQLLQYLQSQTLMTLSTKSETLWISSVYYVIDKNFNLYFLSEPQSIHCQAIAKHDEVACAIADSRQKVTDSKVGVQLEGTASPLSNLAKIKWMLQLWNKLNPGFESIINLKNIKTNKIKSRIYKVKPRKIKFFNEKLFGPEGYKLFRF